MSQPIDLSQFPELPPEVKAFADMQFELSVERAARQHEQAVVAQKDVFITDLKELIEKLEDLETAIAETQARIAAVEEKMAASTPSPDKAASPSKERKARALPASLPCVEREIEPLSIAFPCGCGDMVRIGEDRRNGSITFRPAIR